MSKSSDTDNTELGEILDEYSGRLSTYNEMYRNMHHSQERLNADHEHAKIVAKRQINALISKARVEGGIYELWALRQGAKENTKDDKGFDWHRSIISRTADLKTELDQEENL